MARKAEEDQRGLVSLAIDRKWLCMSKRSHVMGIE